MWWASGKRRQTRELATFTRNLQELADGLQTCGATHGALESTGVYGKPVWNLLEGLFAVLLVNAQHIKAVPGRKTDQKVLEDANIKLASVATDTLGAARC